MYVRSLVFQSGQSLLRYASQACSKIQKYSPAESFTTHGEAIAIPNTEVISVLCYRAFNCCFCLFFVVSVSRILHSLLFLSLKLCFQGCGLSWAGNTAKKLTSGITKRIGITNYLNVCKPMLGGCAIGRIRFWELNLSLSAAHTTRFGFHMLFV